MVDALLNAPLEEATESFTNAIYESDFSNTHDRWNLFTQQNALGFLSTESGLLKTDVQQLGSENWHVQLVRGNIALEKDRLYRFSFEGRADPNLAFSYYAGKASAPFNSYSGYQNALLTKEFKPDSTVFTMSDPSDPESRFVFDLGMNTGKSFFKNLKLEELNFLVASIDKEKKESPKIYPNPVSDKLNIDQIPSGTSIALYNLFGQILQFGKVSGTSMEIQMKGLKPGIYLLQLQTQNRNEHYRIIKE